MDYPLILIGNAAGIGHVRKKEIVSSAKTLGLRSETDVLVFEDPAFPDSMTEYWDHAKIASVLSSFFAKAPLGNRRKQASGVHAYAPETTIDVLITFDQEGISGHSNHKSLYHGARLWLQELMKGKTGWQCPVTLYTLASTNIVRKYMALLDAPLTMVLCVLDSMKYAGKKGEQDLPKRLMYLSNVALFRKAQTAMTDAHVSQMLWFRWFWIILSRYMYVNDLKREKVAYG